MLHAAALAVVSALCALAFSAAWRALALRWNWLDRPNARSLHTRPVPRGGGVAIVAAAALSLGLLSRSQLGSASVVVAGFFLTAAVGLWDDRFGLPPLVRLGFQAGAAAAVVAVCGGLDRLPLPAPLDLRLGWLGSVMAFVWIVAVVNFYNFLDGLDGLAATQAIVTGAALALCTWDGLAADVGAALAGACAGFLVFNWSPARLFMGDVGSGALGFAFATAPLLAPPDRRGTATLVIVASLFLFLADATWTLARRVASAERWYEAHRQHLYQRLALSGWSHARVTTLLALAALPPTLLGVLHWRSGYAAAGWLALALGAAFFAHELRLVPASKKT